MRNGDRRSTRHYKRIPKHDLSTPASRLALPEPPRDYFVAIIPGISLGYRRGSKANYWTLRVRRKRSAGPRLYTSRSLAFTDDKDPANGETILAYEQARALALDTYIRSQQSWHGPYPGRPGRYSLPIPPPEPPYTVAHAVRDFVDWRLSNRFERDSSLYIARVYVLPAFGKMPLKDLTVAHIWKWFSAIPTTAATVFTAFGRHPFHPGPPRDEIELRKRCNSANTALGFMQAMLDIALMTGHLEKDFGWRSIRHYRNVIGINSRVLTTAERSTLLATCNPDLRCVVKAALLTGCRLGELQRLRVGDFRPHLGALYVALTKRGNPRLVILSERGQLFFRKLAGRREPSEMMLVPAGYPRWDRKQSHNRLRRAVLLAGIGLPVSYYTFRHTYATEAVMAGVPLHVVAAQLGHASTRMLERHYLHLTTESIAGVLREKMPDLA